MPECPVCGLFNPPEAMRCDCGYDFTNRETGRQKLQAAYKTTIASGIGLLLLGLALLVGAIAIAVAFDVRIALMLWAGLASLVSGLIQLFRGLGQRQKYRTGHHA